MRHSNLVDKYNKAQSLYHKGYYIRASSMFTDIVHELSCIDSDSMGDIHLHNSSESYLTKIRKKKLWLSKEVMIISGIVLLGVIFYFLY